MTLDQEAYEAYANHLLAEWLASGGAGPQSLATGPLPQWCQLSPEIQSAWKATAAWVAGKLSGNHDWQIPLKDAQFAERIRAEAMSGDHEMDHIRADKLLCELLETIGCTQTLEAFQAVEKWYS